MELTKREKTTVLAVFDELCKKPYAELNTFLGSITIRDMQVLRSKLLYEDYCEEHGIRYEDMTEEDFVDAQLTL